MTMTTEFQSLSKLEQYQALYSDMYKDANGFRPQFNPDMTVEDYEEEFEFLQETIRQVEEHRLDQEAGRAEAFERRVAELFNCGAKDRTMALRWIHEAEGSDGDDEYLGYLMGLSYGYFKEAV